MKNYTEHLTSTTPQSQPIPEQPMIRNRAGGWGFEVDDRTRLMRLLILGTAEGSYYASGRDLTREAYTAVERLLESGDGSHVVDTIVSVSESGRAPRQEPAIFALAMALKLGDLPTRRAAAAAAPRVCRTFTHLTALADAAQALGKGGWGPVTRRAFGGWFASKDNDSLAYQLVKYRNREGWSAHDLLELSHHHVDAWDKDRRRIVAWAAGNDEREGKAHPQIESFLRVQAGELTAADVAAEVRKHRLPWEAVPSAWARDLEVQAALFESMPIGTMVRQLGRLTSVGLLTPTSSATRRAVERLGSKEAVQKARLHPMALYLAAKTYASGKGLRGRGSWTPVPQLVDALGTAFEHSFAAVRPSGRRIVVGVDFSGSMSHARKSTASILGGGSGENAVMDIPGFRPSEAAMVMAWLTLRLEPRATALAFDTRPQPFDVHGVETLAQLGELTRQIQGVLHGGTDCAVPVAYAHQHIPDVDAFVIYTDTETWAGSIHPIEAVSKYREKWGVPSKIVSVGLVATGYDLRGRDDAGSLAVVGFDASAPSIISDFVAAPPPEIPQLGR